MESHQRNPISITDLIRKRYDRLAPFYDLMEVPVERFRFSSWRKRLKNKVIGKRGLEAGVGTGKNFRYYPSNVHITAIDVSPRMLDRAEKRAQKLGIDVDGNYKIILPPGTYNIVAYKEGYDPDCYPSLVAVSNTSYTQDFTLNDTVTGTVSGQVEITGGSSKQHVTLSFRQMAQCEDDDIEVRSLNVTKGGDYEVTLPVGPHSIVASTEGGTTKVYGIAVTVGGVTQDITL